MKPRSIGSLAIMLALLTNQARAGADSAYGRLLARHVRPGTVSGIQLNLVDYQELARDPDYAQALREHADANPAALSSDQERLAFWINAYNLLAIKAVIDRYPVASIKDAGSLLFPIWKRKVGTIAGKERSLDEIEHGILRKDFSEPRIHVAIVCASLSCPDLRAEPYAAGSLEEQLDEQARKLLANRTKGMAPAGDGARARASAIFKWFAEDFQAQGGVARFLVAHADAEAALGIKGLTDDDLTYFEYDWSLNDAARARKDEPLPRATE
jgi:hypothetical protein